MSGRLKQTSKPYSPTFYPTHKSKYAEGGINIINVAFRNKYISLLALIIVTLSLDLLFFSSTLEDAQITFRYSLRLSEGFGFGMWNRTGAPVEGFTTFFWMIYLSLFGPNLECIVYAAKITSILSQLSIIILFYTVAHRLHNNQKLANNIFTSKTSASSAFLFSGITLTAYLPLSWYTSTGMETVPFIALISYALFLPILTNNIIAISSITILLVLMRPDGLMFALASPIYYFAVSKNKNYCIVFSLALLTFVALTLFRYNYFGYLMPNTYYAKSENAIGFLHLKAGLSYFASFIRSYFFVFISLFLCLVFIIRNRKTKEMSFFILALCGIGIYFLILAKSGADNYSAFPMWRHALNLFPLIVFCSFFSVSTLSKRFGTPASVLMLLLIVFTPIFYSTPITEMRFLRSQISGGLKLFPNITNDYNNNKLLLWLKDISTEDTIIATSLAGALPLTVDAHHIDILGLNNEYIAHFGTFSPNGPIDSKTDMNYVLDQRPDIIEGYMNAKLILENNDLTAAIAARKKMNIELLSNPIFQNEYLIISNAPYDSFNRILFISSEHYSRIGQKFSVETIPVTNLVNAALYKG